MKTYLREGSNWLAHQRLQALMPIMLRARLEKAAVPTLIQALEDKMEVVRRCAACGLGAAGESAVSELIEVLGKSSESVRVNAVYAPAQMDTSARSTVSALGKALSDPSVEVRRGCIEIFRHNWRDSSECGTCFRRSTAWQRRPSSGFYTP